MIPTQNDVLARIMALALGNVSEMRYTCIPMDKSGKVPSMLSPVVTDGSFLANFSLFDEKTRTTVNFETDGSELKHSVSASAISLSRPLEPPKQVAVKFAGTYLSLAIDKPSGEDRLLKLTVRLQNCLVFTEVFIYGPNIIETLPKMLTKKGTTAGGDKGKAGKEKKVVEYFVLMQEGAGRKHENKVAIGRRPRSVMSAFGCRFSEISRTSSFDARGSTVTKVTEDLAYIRLNLNHPTGQLQIFCAVGTSGKMLPLIMNGEMEESNKLEKATEGRIEAKDLSGLKAYYFACPAEEHQPGTR